MTTIILGAAVVVLLVALGVVALLWQVAATALEHAEDCIIATAEALDGYILDIDMANDLRAEAANIREWRGREVDDGR